jgi:hypothetical protein
MAKGIITRQNKLLPFMIALVIILLLFFMVIFFWQLNSVQSDQNQSPVVGAHQFIVLVVPRLFIVCGQSFLKPMREIGKSSITDIFLSDSSFQAKYMPRVKTLANEMIEHLGGRSFPHSEMLHEHNFELRYETPNMYISYLYSERDANIRYFIYFLHEQGLLKKMYQEFQGRENNLFSATGYTETDNIILMCL